MSSLTNLKYVQLHGNNISDVSAIAELINLISISLYDNPITDQRPLYKLLYKNPDVDIGLSRRGVLKLPTSQLREDIDVNGIVNILDLTHVASNFGEQGNNIADVNGDGIVNILDLVQVAEAIGQTTPTINP